MAAAAAPCFECLEQRIHEDISPEIVVLRGLSSSSLPFASSALCQISLSRDAENSSSDEDSAEFLLVAFVHRDSQCDADAPFLNLVSSSAPAIECKTECYASIKEIVRNYLSGITEDFVLSSLNRFVDGDLSATCGLKFLNLLGLAAYNECDLSYVRHPNISPVLGVLDTPDYSYLLQPKASSTLENVLHYSPDALMSDWYSRFLVYQILAALTHMHNLGVAYRSLRPSSIGLSASSWVWLNLSDIQAIKLKLNVKQPTASASKVDLCREHCPCKAIFADLKLSSSIDWNSVFRRWWTGELSNYEYLLVLNRLAGRRWGDHAFHVVMPWVIDFSVKPDENSDQGWRDLQKSKWRLAKGDEQLDFTYSTSEIPHHISDECLSELAVCSYKARRLPLKLLRSAVRSVYEPNEYPSNMQRLYQWTPDECIPEFYSDPRIFISLHSGMSDLAVPSWAASPDDFISLHRQALESQCVSRNIHHWIDITFGYKLSGQASIMAKNVMLPVSDPSRPRATGRRQLFNRPHPVRRGVTASPRYCNRKGICLPNEGQDNKTVPSSSLKLNVAEHFQSAPKSCLLPQAEYMEALEEAMSFYEDARYLNPCYSCINNHEEISSSNLLQDEFRETQISELSCGSSMSSSFNLSNLLESFEVDDSAFIGFQDFLNWKHKSSFMAVASEDLADDIFSFGCVLAEIHLKRPLFDHVSLDAYRDRGELPRLLHDLPPHVAILVEASIQKDWRRRPSALCLMESEYFPQSIKSAYLFLAPLHVLAKTGNRLMYSVKLASEGALGAMGRFTAQICASFCLPLILSPLSDEEAESALCLLKEFLKYLTPQAIEVLILPAVQKILQAFEYSHLKVSLLQDSFVRDLWKQLGKHKYLEKIHPLVVANLSNSPNRICSSAASVVLVGSSEELGIPVTVHQTILPLIQSFGKGLCSDGIDALVRIGVHLGVNFIIKHILPMLRNVVISCIEVSNTIKSEPVHSWSSLAMIDSFTALDALASMLPVEVVVKELIQEQNFLHVKVLMQTHLDLAVIQVAANTLLAICQNIGPEITLQHVMPQVKDLFADLAFSQASTSSSNDGDPNVSRLKSDEGTTMKSRMDLLLLLYPSFGSLIGVEKLRQCCPVWFLIEQILKRVYKWKWEPTDGTSKSIVEGVNAQRFLEKFSPHEYNPARLLLNGVGWSTPQSQGVGSSMSLAAPKNLGQIQREASSMNSVNFDVENHEPWFWIPSSASCWDGPDFIVRGMGLKDELPWKIKASVLYSARAHPGALRSVAICDDECTVFTGGVGPGFKGSVQKWELPRMNCVSGYYGHDEVVNAICSLSLTGRIASCDGTIHVWNGHTGKLIARYAESSTFSHATRENTEQMNLSLLSGGILSNAFSGSWYTCMHYLPSTSKLVAGTGNGSIRFIDASQDQKLHLWKTDAADLSISSLVTAICSCGSEKFQADGTLNSPSWIACGLSSGICRLLDLRSGTVVANWRCHDGYITKLAAPEEHLLVSSSMDKTLKVWDLRRNPAGSQSSVFRGHLDGISSFSIWGRDVISISKDKIGLASLSTANEDGGQQQLQLQKLYSADRGARNMSVLSTISILPFSRLFLLGTEDGFLKICC